MPVLWSSLAYTSNGQLFSCSETNDAIKTNRYQYNTLTQIQSAEYNASLNAKFADSTHKQTCWPAGRPAVHDRRWNDKITQSTDTNKCADAALAHTQCERQRLALTTHKHNGTLSFICVWQFIHSTWNFYHLFHQYLWEIWLVYLFNLLFLNYFWIISLLRTIISIHLVISRTNIDNTILSMLAMIILREQDTFATWL